ncbi:MAG: cytochrome c [Azonexus sp.]|nr:cytochrome c [Azonexus sp.]MDZ4314437.1 cytochrome c [Azonexus sp.]
MRPLLIATLSLLASLAWAEEPWGTVDLQAAKPLHDKACTGCHIRMYGGDGSKMYTRDGSMLSNKLELLQRVAACSSQVSSGWFPEDESNVAAWLNKHYYHFDK